MAEVATAMEAGAEAAAEAAAEVNKVRRKMRCSPLGYGRL